MAATLTAEGTKSFRSIPRKMRKTLTVDNGSEFADFKEFERKTGLDIYFAKPYSPWQRGAWCTCNLNSPSTRKATSGVPVNFA
jgi:IS30 family transposase